MPDAHKRIKLLQHYYHTISTTIRQRFQIRIKVLPVLCLLCSVGYTHNATAQLVCPASADGFDPDDITDVVLVTGQSNVTGAGTNADLNGLDASDERVFAWTIDPKNNNAGLGWEKASLLQSWHNAHPGSGGAFHNSFVLHFGKTVVQESDCRVVGVIVVDEPGRGISHWDDSEEGWLEVEKQVGDALAALNRTSVVAVLWHQGESDWIDNGTCFTPSGACDTSDENFYVDRLSLLIDRFRAATWVDSDAPFICGETAQSPVNVHLNSLNTDSDTRTACVMGTDLNTRDGVHFNDTALRTIGQRYATEYLDIMACQQNWSLNSNHIGFAPIYKAVDTITVNDGYVVFAEEDVGLYAPKVVLNNGFSTKGGEFTVNNNGCVISL